MQTFAVDKYKISCNISHMSNAKFCNIFFVRNFCLPKNLKLPIAKICTKKFKTQQHAVSSAPHRDSGASLAGLDQIL